jgi:agmatinase
MLSIIGIPFDEKSSFQKGPALAPPIIRNHFKSEGHGSYAENGVDTNSPLIEDLGDLEIEDYFDIEVKCSELLAQGKTLLTLGGDHSITYPILKAYKRHYDQISVLVIDAHTDLYDEYQNDRYSHACPFARIMEDNIAKQLVQLGIRTLNPHQIEQAKKFDVEVIQMKDYHLWSLPEFQGPVYISIDLDGLDPAYAPGVSHQEPGGLSTRDVIEIIQSINTPIIGADIVEYNPKNDIRDMTAYVAAKLMKELISVML